MNLFVKTVTLFTAGIGMLGCNPQKEEAQRPSILFIMSDDHAYQAISAYGHDLNETPNIDRLAEEGAIFTRASVTNEELREFYGDSNELNDKFLKAYLDYRGSR